jgi:hypothetical protein
VLKWFQTELTVLQSNRRGSVLSSISSRNFTNSTYRYLKTVFLDFMHMSLSYIIVWKFLDLWATILRTKSQIKSVQQIYGLASVTWIKSFPQHQHAALMGSSLELFRVLKTCYSRCN